MFQLWILWPQDRIRDGNNICSSLFFSESESNTHNQVVKQEHPPTHLHKLTSSARKLHLKQAPRWILNLWLLTIQISWEVNLTHPDPFFHLSVKSKKLNMGNSAILQFHLYPLNSQNFTEVNSLCLDLITGLGLLKSQMPWQQSKGNSNRRRGKVTLNNRISPKSPYFLPKISGVLIQIPAFRLSKALTLTCM